MMSNKLKCITRSLLLVMPVVMAEKKHFRTKVHPAGNIHQDLNKNHVNCVVHELGAVTMPGKEGTEKLLSCSAENFGPTVQLHGNYDKFFGGNLVSGVTSMTIPSILVSASLSVNLDEPLAAKSITISNGGREKRGSRRRLALRGGGNTKVKTRNRNSKTGSYSVLVVRVSDTAGHSPTYSAQQISDSIFNGYVSLAAGYSNCSNNQLYFYKARGGSVKNGVVDVVVDQDLSAAYDSNICVNAADAALLSSSYDVGTSHSYTMYICPDVVEFGSAAGVAQMGGTKSWFKDKLGSLPFVQMHEIGHNLMFFHSSEGKLEYGDPTGFMGGMYEEHRQDWGKMCLNAAKTYQSGWYSQYHANIDPMFDPYIGSLVDVNSVYMGNIRENHDVVVRIESSTDEETLYFMLHRLEGITSDMVADFIATHANRVNIISQRYSEGVPSQAVGQLASGEEYVRKDWAGTGKDLHIKVCSIAEDSATGGAKVVVYLEGETFASCASIEDTRPPSQSSSTK